VNKHNLFLLKARVADTVAAMQTGSRRRILPVCTLIALMTANVGVSDGVERQGYRHGPVRTVTMCELA
jgi:hypothetical protein